MTHQSKCVWIWLAVVMLSTAALGANPDLLGYWKLNEGTGTTVADLSDNGNNGTFSGTPEWIDDPDHGFVVEFDGSDYIGTDVRIPAMTLENGFTWAFWCKQTGDGAGVNNVILGNRYGGTGDPLQFIKFTPTNFEYYRGGHQGTIAYTNVPADEWVHLVVVKDGANLTHYRNGVATESNTTTVEIDGNPFSMGGDSTNGAEYWTGSMSEVLLFTAALDLKTIQAVMAGKGLSPELAGDPSPAIDGIDIPRDQTLTWAPGEFAAKHNVYVGTNSEDVDAASLADPLGTIVGQDLSDTAFAPGRLEFNTTYYWRVDEVNGTPDRTVFKGEPWSFTVEPLAIPIENIAATASGASPDMGPEKTIDGSGLNAQDEHSSMPVDMWLTDGADIWIQYEFDKVYKLHELLVWNSNQAIEPFIGFGMKGVTIETSTDGETWSAIAGVPELARATGLPNYVANTTVDMGGTMAKLVKITAISAHGVLPQMGLAEVRFLALPVFARAPLPADGTIPDNLDITLSWRAGREADSHDVRFNTDMAALADSTVATVAETAYTVDVLTLDTTYYWQIIEVNEAQTPAAHIGDIWSFTTPLYIAVDDFESYSGDEGSEVFMTWWDGFSGDATLGGSTTGHIDGPFVETSNVNSGRKSMPVYIDNDGGFFDIDGKTSSPNFSEVARELDSAQDWTASGIKTLTIMFAGSEGLSGQLYCKIGGTKVLYDGDAANLSSAAWQAWQIDLSTIGGNLKSVRELAIGVEGGSSGILYIDDIRVGI
jgi:hypothetical protein